MINTFISSQSSLENPTRSQTKMGKVYTSFQTKKAQKPYPLGRHTLMAYIKQYPAPGGLPQFSGKSSLRTPNHDQGQEPKIMQRLWLQSRQINSKKASIQVDMRRWKSLCSKRATCFPTLQQNKPKRWWAFYHLRIKPGLQRSQSFAGYKKLLQRMWRVLLIRG